MKADYLFAAAFYSEDHGKPTSFPKSLGGVVCDGRAGSTLGISGTADVFLSVGRPEIVDWARSSTAVLHLHTHMN